jgi:hypothetical protein
MRKYKSRHPYFGIVAGICTVALPFLALTLYQGQINLDLSWLSTSDATAREIKPVAPDEKIRQFISVLPEVQAYGMWHHQKSQGRTAITVTIKGTPQSNDYGFWTVNVAENHGSYVKLWNIFRVNASTGDTYVQSPRGGRDVSLQVWRTFPIQQQLRNYYQKYAFGQ